MSAITSSNSTKLRKINWVLIWSIHKFFSVRSPRWCSCRYPLQIFNSAKRSPRGGLRFPLLNVSNGHRQLHQPIAWKWWKKWCRWENQLISRNLTWISTIKSTKSKKATSELFFFKKNHQKRFTELGESFPQNLSTCWGGPYEWTKVPLENPARASLGDSHVVASARVTY